MTTPAGRYAVACALVLLVLELPCTYTIWQGGRAAAHQERQSSRAVYGRRDLWRSDGEALGRAAAPPLLQLRTNPPGDPAASRRAQTELSPTDSAAASQSTMETGGPWILPEGVWTKHAAYRWVTDKRRNAPKPKPMFLKRWKEPKPPRPVKGAELKQRSVDGPDEDNMADLMAEAQNFFSSFMEAPASNIFRTVITDPSDNKNSENSEVMDSNNMVMEASKTFSTVVKPPQKSQSVSIDDVLSDVTKVLSSAAQTNTATAESAPPTLSPTVLPSSAATDSSTTVSTTKPKSSTSKSNQAAVLIMPDYSASKMSEVSSPATDALAAQETTKPPKRIPSTVGSTHKQNNAQKSDGAMINTKKSTTASPKVSPDVQKPKPTPAPLTKKTTPRSRPTKKKSASTLAKPTEVPTSSPANQENDVSVTYRPAKEGATTSTSSTQKPPATALEATTTNKIIPIKTTQAPKTSTPKTAVAKTESTPKSHLKTGTRDVPLKSNNKSTPVTRPPFKSSSETTATTPSAAPLPSKTPSSIATQTKQTTKYPSETQAMNSDTHVSGRGKPSKKQQQKQAEKNHQEKVATSDVSEGPKLRPPPSGGLGLEHNLHTVELRTRTFVTNNNRLVLRVYRAFVAERERDSLVLSTQGISTSLAMLFFAARGITSEEINRVLHMDNMRAFNPHIGNFKFNRLLNDQTSPHTGAICNLFLKERIRGDVYSGFHARLYRFYRPNINSRTQLRQSQYTVKVMINSCMRKHSAGKVASFVHNHKTVPRLDPSLVTVSGTYFNGTLSPHLDISAEEMRFSSARSSSSVSTAGLMVTGAVASAYSPSGDCTVTVIPFHGEQLQLVLLLPGRGRHRAARGFRMLQQLESRLTPDVWRQIARDVTVQNVQVTFPHISVRTDVEMRSTLNRMGIRAATDQDQADFSGVNGLLDLTLGGVLQLTEFHVSAPANRSEDGRQHRSLWWVDGGRLPWETPLPTTPHPEPLLERSDNFVPVTYDRPFLFLVRHNPTGALLLMGRYTGPQAEQGA